MRIGDIVQFSADGVEDTQGGYFGFWLDINEPGTDAGRTLLLDELEFFISDRADLNKYTPQDNPENTNTSSPEPGAGSLERRRLRSKRQRDPGGRVASRQNLGYGLRHIHSQ